MSQYATSEYYYQTFKGKQLQIEAADKYLQYASEKIDDITYNRIVKIGFDKLTDFQQDKIQKAVCYQAEYIMVNGFNDDKKQDVSSYSVLDISVTPKNKTEAEKTEAEKLHLSENAFDQIKKTGLNCGVMR